MRLNETNLSARRSATLFFVILSLLSLHAVVPASAETITMPNAQDLYRTRVGRDRRPEQGYGPRRHDGSYGQRGYDYTLVLPNLSNPNGRLLHTPD